MKPKYQRLIFILVSMVFLIAATLFAMSAFRENLVFFYSPTDLTQKTIAADQSIRVGGLVKEGSIVHGEGEAIGFVITDGKNDVNISYVGLLPNLFREGQGCIAEGTLQNGTLIAKKILAKHDEKYMPKEVVDALKRSGEWRGGEEQ
jgi:cytochrome c-type biogenesis protein CcmE